MKFSLSLLALFLFTNPIALARRGSSNLPAGGPKRDKLDGWSNPSNGWGLPGGLATPASNDCIIEEPSSGSRKVNPVKRGTWLMNFLLVYSRVRLLGLQDEDFFGLSEEDRDPFYVHGSALRTNMCFTLILRTSSHSFLLSSLQL